MPDKKQIFPIKTSTACLLKWGWSSIFFQSGTTNSCHRTQLHKIPVDDFGSFHNVPKKIEDRQRMLKGEWPKNDCMYCKKFEDAGHYSDRINQLHQQTDPNCTPPELLKDPTATHVTPTMVEVYFKNTCNMSCVYCGPHLSSKWEEEIKKHGEMPEMKKRLKDPFSIAQAQHNPFYEKQKEDFWNYLATDGRYKVLRWFSLLGGEPLVLPEFDECLDFWQKHPNENLTFQMVTNLKADQARFSKFLDKIDILTRQKKIYQFKVIASLDCFSPETEYVRYGMKLQQWNENFERLLSMKNVSLGINSAISALTLPTFETLLHKIKQWNVGRSVTNRIIHSFNLDTGLTDPKMLGGQFYEKTLEKCTSLFEVKNGRELSIKRHWQGIAEQIKKSEKNTNAVANLKTYLGSLDFRRGTNWKETFPWLLEE
jgi:organic radical activating enzyme